MSIATTAEPAHTAAWMTDILDETGQKAMTTEQALEATDLDFTVQKVPVYGEFVTDSGVERIDIPNRFGVQRTDTGHIFSTVGKTWQPVQNRDGFQIVDDLLNIAGHEGKAAWIETALALHGGRKVVIMVRLDMDLQIAGEKYHSYLSFINGHDGRTSVTALTHDVRWVCMNGQIGALMESGTNAVRVRHTKNAGSRIKEAVQILGMRNRQAELLAQQGEWLVQQSVSDAEFDRFIESLMPIDEETTTPHETMIKNRREGIRKVYMQAPNLDPIRGTRWGVLQSVLEYADHGRDFKNVDTAVCAQLGLNPTPVKEQALVILSDKKLRPVDQILA